MIQAFLWFLNLNILDYFNEHKHGFPFFDICRHWSNGQNVDSLLKNIGIWWNHVLIGVLTSGPATKWSRALVGIIPGFTEFPRWERLIYLHEKNNNCLNIVFGHRYTVLRNTCNCCYLTRYDLVMPHGVICPSQLWLSLRAPFHYLTPCWIIMCTVLLHSVEIIIQISEDAIPHNKIEIGILKENWDPPVKSVNR